MQNWLPSIKMFSTFSESLVGTGIIASEISMLKIIKLKKSLKSIFP